MRTLRGIWCDKHDRRSKKWDLACQPESHLYFCFEEDEKHFLQDLPKSLTSKDET